MTKKTPISHLISEFQIKKKKNRFPMCCFTPSENSNDKSFMGTMGMSESPHITLNYHQRSEWPSINANTDQLSIESITHVMSNVQRKIKPKTQIVFY